MHKKIGLYMFLLIPVILIALLIYISDNFRLSTTIYYLILVLPYSVGIAGIILVAKLKPFNPWWLLLSFSLSPISVYIYERGRGGWLQYLGTALVILFYAAPFVLASTVVSIVCSVKAYRRKRMY
ncbi:MAG: hypothetical protein FWD82_06325 [Defluviitaleaceae bacterium]|nr:hypothetical protein [Defluviitaleaceae bacterium]